MIVTFIRTLIIFSTLFLVIRLMGKRQIGEMQPFEFLITLIIADLACVPMADVSIALIYGIVGILGLFLFHQVLSLLESRGNLIKGIINGKPALVINKLGVDIKELKKNNLGVEDLIETLRAMGYFSLDSVDYAIFESNGKLSAMESEIKCEKISSIPILLVNDGKIVKDNLKKINLEKSSVVSFLESTNGKVFNTEILTVDGNGRAYLKRKNQKYKILNFSLPEGVKW